MQSIILARVDQRLLHGIVVTEWTPLLRVSRVMVIDDEVANNEMSKASLKLSKPAGVNLSIIDTKTAIHNFSINKYNGQSIFLIVKEPDTLIKLLDNGVVIPKVNIGIMFYKEGKEKLSNFVSIDMHEKEMFKEINKRGIPVKLQYVPSDNEEDFMNYVK